MDDCGQPLVEHFPLGINVCMSFIHLHKGLLGQVTATLRQKAWLQTKKDGRARAASSSQSSVPTLFFHQKCPLIKETMILAQTVRVDFPHHLRRTTAGTNTHVDGYACASDTR